MPLGGGTFTEYDKVIPGVYVNFKDIVPMNYVDSQGHVVIICPVTEIVSVDNYLVILTRQTYLSNTVTPVNLELSTFQNFLREVFINATEVYLIKVTVENIPGDFARVTYDNVPVLQASQISPLFNNYKLVSDTDLKTTWVSSGTTGTTLKDFGVLKTEDTIETIITEPLTTLDPTVTFTVIEAGKGTHFAAGKTGIAAGGVYQEISLADATKQVVKDCLDHFFAKYHANILMYYSTPYLTENVTEVLLEHYKDRIVPEVAVRYMLLFGINLTKTQENKYQDISEWILVPYHHDASFFLAGLISNLTRIESLSGVTYNGYLSPENWVIPLNEQKTCIENGILGFYTIGDNYKILKDVTIGRKLQPNNFNAGISQISRLKIYLYATVCNLFGTYVQGKANSSSNRAMLRNLIFIELKRLVSWDVIEDITESSITVEQTPDKKDSMTIVVQVTPTIGTDYIYITFEVA